MCAEAGDPKAGGRNHVRHAVALDTEIRVYAAGKQRTALIAQATIENLSEKGACIYIQALKEEQVSVLRGAPRQCWLVCDFPGGEVFSFLSGNITWVDVCTDGSRSNAQLGVQFVDMLPTERHRLEQFLDRVTAGG